jgi:hypothetical protein
MLLTFEQKQPLKKGPAMCGGGGGKGRGKGHPRTGHEGPEKE